MCHAINTTTYHFTPPPPLPNASALSIMEQEIDERQIKMLHRCAEENIPPKYYVFGKYYAISDE